MTPKFFDIHSHINDVRFDDDRDEVLARMREGGFSAIDVGTDAITSARVVALSEKSDGIIFACIGVHPIDDLAAEFDEEFFAKLADSASVVAVGECGLDYSRLNEVTDITTEKLRQKKLFEAQVDFAIKRNLPLMIHCRDSSKDLADAHRDVLDLLNGKKKTAGATLRGNIHFYSQTIEIAHEYIALGFTISFTGVITFTNEYDDVVRETPIESIMAETDCPYVAPKSRRGKRNEPIFVEEVYKKIAELRGEDFEIVRATLVQNALRSFKLAK